jgi:hypothetical protein
MMRKGTENRYELPCCGSHKILKVITNGTVRPHFGFLTDTINIVKYEMTFNGSHKILKVITNGTVRLDFGFLTYQTLKETSAPFMGVSAICDFLRREDELMTELMNHKRSTSY